MRTTFFIIVISVTQIFAENTYSQSTRLSVNLKNVATKTVLSQLEDKSQFYFIYDATVVDVERKISIESDNELITNILDEVFEGTNIIYKIKDRQIALTTEPISSVVQPQKSISGKVTDSSGAPLPGVSVVVKGTTTGSITDANGNYSLTNIPENAILQFSFVGMKGQEIAAGSKTTINVTLAEETVGIEEVVAVGYGTQRKVSLTGSVVDVKNDKLVNIPVANVSSTLAGMLPGVIAVQQSGEPGQDAASISIRGFGSPLTIVDGVERSFNQIDPNEIESISVLKDASASIYGARAGNGVILINTKRGASGKPVININVNTAWQSPTRLPKYVNSGEYAQSFNDALRNSGSPLQFTDYQVKAYQAVSGYSVDFTDAEKAQFNTEKGNFANTDWVGVVFKPSAPLTQYNLSSTGGNDKIKYLVSVGYLDQNSILRSGADSYKKYSFRSNIDAQITRDLSVGFDLSGCLEQLNYAQFDIGGIWNNLMNDPPIYAVGPDTKYATGNGQAAADPGKSGTRKTTTKNLGGSISMKYSVPFVKGLSVKAKFDYLMAPVFQKNFFKAYDIYTYSPATDTYSFKVNGSSHINSLTETWSEPITMVSKLFLNYENTFGKHSIKAMIIGEYTDNSYNILRAYRSGFYTTAIEQLFAGSATGQTCTGSESADGRISYASRLNYSYSDKYLLETTFRYDASPRFAPDQRWGFFPSVLAGWRLSEESFIKDNLQFVNNLKFRLSYGQTGIDNIASYNYLSGYQYSGGFVDNSNMQLGLESKGLANIATTWEKHTTYNAGLDFGLWDNKMYGFFDVFYKERSGILATRLTSLPTTFGASLPSENLNSANYRGFELQLGYKNHIGKIEYNIDGNIAWNRAKNGHIEEADYSSADEYTKLRYQQSGQWTNRYFGLQAAGLFQSQAEIDGWPVIQDGNLNKTLRPGDIKYLDFDGDKKITQLDYHVIGKGNSPEVTYGLNINARWKEFDLRMLFQGATSYGTIEPSQRPYPYIPSSMFSFQMDYWTPENPDAKYPRIGNSGFTNNKYPSTFWLIDAYYVRLKNIQLGYSLPTRLLKSTGLSNLRLYASAINLLTISNLNYFDPEIPTGMETYSFFPQQKTISFGINMTF